MSYYKAFEYFYGFSEHLELDILSANNELIKFHTQKFLLNSILSAAEPESKNGTKRQNERKKNKKTNKPKKKEKKIVENMAKVRLGYPKMKWQKNNLRIRGILNLKRMKMKR